MRNKFKGKIAFFVLAGIAMVFAVSGMVMWLWNCLLPEIIGVKTITFWQAMGILVLSKILFGGFGGKGFNKDKFRRLKEERMSGMSPEEKEKFKEIWKQRCERGFFGDKC
ncbi:MAG: hypothetical protein L6264_05675 [Weeksellaceae bacterium]|nr:hypothetical protein [Bacteroidota bacterium]MCG2780419.1 hypothetical protein [Weeksellaceae bacterium]